jgi:hypothetical protein
VEQALVEHALALFDLDALFLVEHAFALFDLDALFLVLHAFVEQAFVLPVFKPTFESLLSHLHGWHFFVCFDIPYSPFLFLLLLFVKTCRIIQKI